MSSQQQNQDDDSSTNNQHQDQQQPLNQLPQDPQQPTINQQEPTVNTTQAQQPLMHQPTAGFQNPYFFNPYGLMFPTQMPPNVGNVGAPNGYPFMPFSGYPQPMMQNYQHMVPTNPQTIPPDTKKRKLFLNQGEVDSTVSSEDEDMNSERLFLLEFIKEKNLIIQPPLDKYSDIALSYLVENAYIERVLAEPTWIKKVQESLKKFSNVLSFSSTQFDAKLFTSRSLRSAIIGFDTLERISLCIRTSRSIRNRLELIGLFHCIAKLVKQLYVTSAQKHDNVEDGVTVLEQILSCQHTDQCVSDELDKASEQRQKALTSSFMVSQIKTNTNSSKVQSSNTKEKKNSNGKKTNVSSSTPKPSNTFQR